MFEDLVPFLPLIITLAVLQLGLMIAAIVHILRHDSFRFVSKAVWLVIVILVSTIGPVCYFVFGRGEQ